MLKLLLHMRWFREQILIKIRKLGVMECECLYKILFEREGLESNSIERNEMKLLLLCVREKHKGRIIQEEPLSCY